MQPLNIQYFDVTVRVGCSLVYEVTGTASLLLNLKLCPDRNHAVLSEALALGNNLPAKEFSVYTRPLGSSIRLLRGGGSTKSALILRG